MTEIYLSLRDELKHILNRFRFGQLFSDLLSGMILLSCCFLLYLLFYSFILYCFNITVGFKTVLYIIFVICSCILFCYSIIYPFILFILSLNLKNNRLQQKVLNYLGKDKDIFISLYNLAFNFESVSGNDELKKAAFVQKYNTCNTDQGKLVFPYRKLMNKLILLGVLLLIIFFNGKGINRVYSDLKAYQEVSNPRLNIEFHILNKSLNVEYGKPFKLEARIESEYLSVDNVFICFGGGEFLMDKKDSSFIYDFDVVNNDLRFYFKTCGIESESFKINVLPTPEITDYQVSYTPPPYTGLKTDILKNVVDFRALYGSTLKFDIDFSELDSLFLKSGDDIVSIALRSASKTDFSKIIHNSGEFSLYGSNKHFSKKNLINFSVTCIPDLYPGIQITAMQDSLKTSLYYFYGVITDDFGFSDLRFNYSVNSQSPVVMPVNIVKNTATQEFYFSFDFAEFAGMDKAKIKYFFEVFDNDIISGPKSTRSDNREYLVPDLNTIFDYNLQANDQVNSSLNEVEKLAKEIVSGVKELQKKMLDNTTDNWEKQQLSKDIVDKKDKLDKLLQAVKEENQKKSSLNQNFTKQDSVLLHKQDQIQQLMDKIMDDEMKKLMEEFSKLSQEFSKDKFQDLDEKMKLSFDQMSEELDRNIELLKRFQIEEKHDLISKQFDKLKENQEAIKKALNDKSVSKDSLSSLNKELKDQLDNVKNNYQDLLKDNRNLSEPYKLKEFKTEFNELSQMIDKQEKDLSKGQKDSENSKDIEKKMDELSNKMDEQQQQNFMQMALPENDIELIIQNILIISLSQEELLKEFPKTSTQSSRYNELGRIQDLKKLQYKIVKDSLSALAKSNLMLASVLSDKLYDVEIKFGLLPGYIQDNKRSELSKEQQYIINYLNDIALSLTDALQKSKAQSKGSSGSKGSKNKDKNGNKGENQGNDNEGYGRMKQYQQSIKDQLQNLVSKMKNGEKGKPLQQGVSKMIRENELFRKSLNDFISESGSLTNGEKQLLNEINKLLEENIRDIANYSISGNLINRNNQIYNKLLMSEKASKEREEFEEKRKSVTAKDTRFDKPEVFFDMQKKSGLIKTDLRKSDIKLNSFFKNMYNNYYIKLGNE